MLETKNGVAIKANLTIDADGRIGLAIDDDVRIIRKEDFEVACDRYKTVKDNNDKLRMLLGGMKVCNDDEADAKDCPLYDEDEPYHCKKESLMRELGIEVDGD